MASASIIAMNHSVGTMELETETKSQPTGERSHYWHILRRNQRGQWKVHSEFMGTKAEVAEHWRKFFHGRKNFRLSHELSY